MGKTPLHRINEDQEKSIFSHDQRLCGEIALSALVGDGANLSG